MHSELLEPSLRDLRDALDDFYSAKYGEASNVLGRMVAAFDAEPLAGFLRHVLPSCDLATWLSECRATQGGMAGSAVLKLPHDRSARVALQVGLVRQLSSKESELYGFAGMFTRGGSTTITDHYSQFGRVVLEPMLRDIERLSEERALPPIIFEAIGSLPTSGDSTLDDLLALSVRRFRDPTPEARSSALEALWDAWERLKTLDIPGDKKRSAGIMLDRVTNDTWFRAHLDAEAKALTELGNQFHIRHFETDKRPVPTAEAADYLYQRLFALVRLILFARSDPRAAG